MTSPQHGNGPRAATPAASSGTRILRQIAGVVAGALLIALGAAVSLPVPGSAVPQTLQSLAVVLCGALLGMRLGVAAVALYLVLGIAGLPIFAGESAGLERLLGPTAGYLVGFVAAAALVGAWARSELVGQGLLGLFIGCLIAHDLILAFGCARLALDIGWTQAWQRGGAPFLMGALLKSLIAAAVVLGWRRVARRRTRPASSPAPH